MRTTTAEHADVHEDQRAHRKRELALAYRLFAAQRWGDLGDGHISARDPQHTDCFWMLRSDVSFHRATTNDLTLVAPDGSVVDGGGTVSQPGYRIHQPIHDARPDVVCAAHVHTPWGTPFSAEVRPVQPITQESCLFFDNHAIFDDEEVQILSTDGGQRIASALGAHSGIVLRNHGLLTVAGSVAEAVGLFVIFERVAEAHLKTREPKRLSDRGALTARAHLEKDGAGSSAFNALLRRHIEDRVVVDRSAG